MRRSKTYIAGVLLLAALAAVAAIVIVRDTSSGSGGEERRVLWGAAIGPQLTGEQAPFDMGAVRAFAEVAGKRPSIVHFYSPFAGCEAGSCHAFPFPTEMMQRIRRYGAIPMLSWSSQSIPSQIEEPRFRLARVAAGDFDRYVRRFAIDAREWGHPFFLRFDWEMNGNWFPWGVGANGNSAADFVAAWRHVHRIFTQVGAENVAWVWNPNVDPRGQHAPLGPLYPGDAYVDWTGLDGYDFGNAPGAPRRRVPFDELFGPTYREVTGRIAPGKPLMIGEVGASERGGRKPAWLSEMLTAVPKRFPKVGAVVYFDTYDDGMDWPLETSKAAEKAFVEGIAAPIYVPGVFADTGGAEIGLP
jgi:hypothetical protein